MKTCKQCGEFLPDVNYRQYKSRSTGKRQCTTGSSPVCKACESFNARVTVAYKAVPRTERQEELVRKAMQVYVHQLQRGLKPNGPLAKSLYPKHMTDGPSELDKYLNKHLPSDVAPAEVNDPITKALQELLYNPVDDSTERKLYDIMEQCNDGKDNETYKSLIDQIWYKIDEYDEQQ